MSKQKKKSKKRKSASTPGVDKLTTNQRIENWLAKNGKWVLILGWLFFLILYLSLATDELGGVLGGDNVRYLMLARALAEGKGYKDFYLPGEPAHTQYPFLFPLFLSPFALSARPVFYSHLLIQFFASFIPFLVCAWAVLEGESRLKSLLLFFLVGSIPAFYSFLLNILTEVFFMFFMFGIFFLLSYARRQGFKGSTVFILTFLLLASAFTRELGLVLFLSVITGMIFDRKMRVSRLFNLPVWVVVSLGFLLGYGCWVGRNILSGQGGFYFRQFLEKNPYLANSGWITVSDLTQRIKSNIPLHIPHLGGFAFPNWLFNSTELAWGISLIFFIVITIGIINRLLNRNFIAEFSFISLLAVALVWFFKEERFSLPLLPACGFYFLQGLNFIENFIKPKKSYLWVVLLLLSLWQIGFSIWLCFKYHQKKEYPLSAVAVKGYGTWSEPVIDISKYTLFWLYPENHDIGLGDWIVIQKVADTILPQPAVLACRKPTIAWFYAKRKATWYKFGVFPDEQWKHLQQNNITHLLVAPNNPELVSLINAFPRNFKLLALIERSGLAVLEIDHYPEP